MKLLILSLTITLLASETRSECPKVNDLPVYIRGNTFFCARFYYGHGNDLDLHACNGCSVADHYDVADGQDADAGHKMQYPIGSLLVRPGCTFYQFNENYYNGGWKVYEGPGVWPKIENGPESEDKGCARGRPCFMCRCSMRHFSCVPEDKFEVVMVCDATKAEADTECNYIKTVGTTYSESFANSMSIDTTIKYEMEAKFFDLFSEKLGISVSTGYNWGSVSSETISEEVSIEITTTAPKGYVLSIEQAVGHCDGSKAKTEMFRIKHTDPEGKVVKQELKRMFSDGTEVTLDQ